MTEPTAPAPDALADLVGRIQSAGAQPTPSVPATNPNPTAARTTRYHENVTTTSLDDESVSSSEFDVYKGRKGFTDRIALLYPSRIMAARVHFIPTQQGGSAKSGYLICASKFSQQGGQEVPVQLAPCCEKLDVSRKRFAALVVQYNTDPRGGPIKPFGYSLRVWRFNPDIFVTLRATHKEWPLTAHDLNITCTDEQYQKITVQACRESIAASEDFQKLYGETVTGWVNSMLPRLERTLGKRLTAPEWNEVLYGTAAAAQAGPADSPVESIAALLQVPSA